MSALRSHAIPQAEEPAAWHSIAQQLLSHKHEPESLQEQRPLFEEFLSKFPTAVRTTCMTVSAACTLLSIVSNADHVSADVHPCIYLYVVCLNSACVQSDLNTACLLCDSMHCVQALHWKAYAELAMAVNSPEVRNIFSRSLLSCPSVDLWSTYLTFIKRVSVRSCIPSAFTQLALQSRSCSRCACAIVNNQLPLICIHSWRTKQQHGLTGWIV